MRRALPAAVTSVVVAAVMRLVYDPWYLNYDARYSLLWARDLWQGYTPEYRADFAPTPHPLQTAVSSLALPFGDSADQVIVWMVLLCFGLVGYLLYRLGTQLFNPWAGAVAAVVVLTRPIMQRDALLAYQDIPFAALIIGAVLLEARRPRRGAPVLALLALAGLLRPEAWALAGLYWLYLWPAATARARVAGAALVAAAPVIWALTDWLVTGDLLHSLHGTAALAEAVDRRRDIVDAPYWTVQYYGFTLREPLVVGVPIGLAFAWWHCRGRAAALPLAVAAVMTAIFMIGPLFGLPLIGRYVRTPAALLALFYGLACFGWMLLPAGTSRTRWRAAGLLAIALSVAFLPKHVDMLRQVHDRIELDGAHYGDLRRAARAPAVREAFASCAPLSTADRRPIPFVRYWLDGPPGSVGTIQAGASPLGKVLLVPKDNRFTRRVYRGGLPAATPPSDYAQIYDNRSLRVFAAPGCVTRRRR